MKFDEPPPAPNDGYRHRIIFDSGEEASTVWSAYRELVLLKTLSQTPIHEHELKFSEHEGEDEEQRTGILTDGPEHVAEILEEFHERTDEAILAIAQRAIVPHETDDIARRISMGKRAGEIAKLLRASYMMDQVLSDLTSQEPALLAEGDEPAPHQEG